MKRRLANGQGFLEAGSIAWQQAMRFNEFYELLHDKLRGDEVVMYHWLRAKNDALEMQPFFTDSRPWSAGVCYQTPSVWTRTSSGKVI